MPPTSVKCKIWWDDTVQAYSVSVPYNANFVAAIKALVPVSERGFNEVSKVWTFTEPYLAAMETLARQLWHQPGEVVVVTKANTRKATTAPMATQGAAPCALEFLRILGFEAVRSAYRAAAVQFHPDKDAANGERMAQINSLWDRIQKEVFGK